MLSLRQIPALLHAAGIEWCECSLVPQTFTLAAGGGSWLLTTVLTILPDRAVHMSWPLQIFFTWAAEFGRWHNLPYSPIEINGGLTTTMSQMLGLQLRHGPTM